MAIEDRFPGFTGVNSGAMGFPTSRSVKIAPAGFDDEADLAFRCRCFTADMDGILMVDTSPDGQVAKGVNVELQVFTGLNAQRIDRIYATGSDPITVNIRD